MTYTEDSAAGVPELVTLVLSMTPEKQFWFRGQGCAERKLNPSLWRALKPLAGQAEVLSVQVLDLEQRLLTRFRQRSLQYWPAGYPQTDWEHLFAMQHHGLATRLLDWTVNLLMGVWFALDHDASKCECGTNACKPAVWILDPVNLNASNPRLDGLPNRILATSDKQLIRPWEPGVSDNEFAPAPVAIYGTYNSDRIAAQHGSFTVGGKTLKPLDEIAPAGVLTKVVMTEDRQVIRRQLSLMGVTRSTVYPGLAELAADIAEEEIYQ